MFSDAPILIVEDNLYLALDLSSAVEEMAGRVVGPAASVEEALSLLESHPIAGAIVDCHFGEDDAAPLTRKLAERQVPFVIHTAAPPPPAISEMHPDVPVLRKPVQPGALLTCLLDEIRKASGRESGQ